jgi:hypothetical protein
MKKGILIINLIALPCALLAGSIFSGGGIGLMNQSYGGRETGLGGVGIGLPDSGAVGSLNPAVWGKIYHTRFSLGVNFCRNLAKDEHNSDLSDKFALQYTALGISLKPGLVIGIRIFPESRIDYRQVSFVDLGSTQYEEIYIGSGGISSGSMILAGKLKKDIYIGGGIDFLFGNLDTRWRTIISSPTIYSEFSKIDQVMGFRYNIGLFRQIDTDKAIGIFAANEAELDITEELDYTYSDSTVSIDKKLYYPAALGFGFSFPLNKKVIGNIDFLWNGWNGDKQEIGDKKRYQNSQLFAFGLERTPETEPFTPYIKRITYRGGLTLRNLYYRTPNGKTVSEISVTVGAGLPLKAEGTRLDVAFNFGKRGSLSENNAEEFFFNTGIYLNVGEKWFVRKKKY